MYQSRLKHYEISVKFKVQHFFNWQSTNPGAIVSLQVIRHAPRKVPIHLEAAFKEEFKSLVKLGILEEVKEHTVG